jgi:hypothetical protein
MDLAELTIDAIKPYVGTIFEVPLPDGTSTKLTLDAALPYEVRQRRPRNQPKREPFSLFLIGDPSLILPQGMYELRSEVMTLEGLFIVPVGRNDEGTEYEAVFT